jgi:hypothetical protein
VTGFFNCHQQRATSQNVEFRLQVLFLRGLIGEIMTDPATYRKYAKARQRLATTAPENDRRVFMEHAGVWLQLAEEAEREADAKT